MARLVVLITLLALVVAQEAAAVEYRLQVVSLHYNALVSFLGARAVYDGAASPGLDRLEAEVDRAGLPAGVLLYDRPLESVPGEAHQGFGAARVRGEIRPSGAREQWQEVRWEGNPGERSLWIVAGSARAFQEVYQVALKGNGPLRYFTPYGASWNGKPVDALRLPLAFMHSWQERPDFWQRHLAGRVNLENGIALVVGENQDLFSSDHVYVLVQQGSQPGVFKVVLGWRQRPVDVQSPSTAPLVR
jgi:hypothetical protein